jgi:hypothetical protein
MPIRTLTLSVPASREAVFHYLANIENLPRWAPEFCSGVALSRHGWFALTALGELFLELEADEHTGVIDLRAGAETEPVWLLPMRVLASPSGGTLLSVVFYPTSGQTPEQFARSCDLLAHELTLLSQDFGRGELHEDAAMPSVEAQTVRRSWSRIA